MSTILTILLSIALIIGPVIAVDIAWLRRRPHAPRPDGRHARRQAI